MRRRELLIGLGAAAAAPGDAGAQPSPWRVGFLHPGQSGGVAMRIGRFEEGLRPFNGGDPVILKGVADDRVEELPRLAVTVVGAGAQVICAVSPPAVRAAINATHEIPILAVDLESDPVANGWARSLGQPGGNLSGVFLDLPDFTAKCLQLLREVIPEMSRLAILWHPASGSIQLEVARKAASTWGLTVDTYEANRIAELEPAFRAAASKGADGILMLSAPMIGGNPKILADLARVHRLPAIDQFPDFTEQGGLLAYGPDVLEMFRQAGTMARKVLVGAPIANLPIDRPARFRLSVNLKTAKTLGLNLPPTLLARADEVIE